MEYGNGPDVIYCDICDKPEYPDDLTPDWNGETGCHLSCENAKRQSVTLSNESYGIIVGALHDRLRQVRQEYEDAVDIGENTSLHRWRRDAILTALREMGVETGQAVDLLAREDQRIRRLEVLRDNVTQGIVRAAIEDTIREG